MNLGLKRLFKSLGFLKHPSLKENKRFFCDLNWNKPLEDYDFVVFDTELTGLEPRNERNCVNRSGPGSESAYNRWA